MQNMSLINNYLGALAICMVLFGAPIAQAQYYDDYGSSDWGYDISDYGSIGDAGYYYSGTSDYNYGYDTNASSQYSYDTSSWNYDVADYGSIGDAGYGCCDSTPSTDWNSYTYDNSSWNYDVADYGSIGDAGYGCCDEEESTDWDTYTYVQDEPEYYYDEPYEYVEYSYNTPSYTQPVYDTVAYNYSYSYPTYPTYNPPTYTHTNPTPKKKPICTLTIHPDDIDEDENAQITWTTNYASSVSITDLGAVSKDGTRSISPDNSKTYTLTAVGDGGSVTCSDTIIVEEDDEDVRCDAFTVSDSSVEDGDRVTLRWNTTGADGVRINNGVGDVENDGDTQVTITRDTTFTLTAQNGSDTDTCTVDVEVEEEDNEEDVRCDAFTVSDSRVEEGDRVTLKWRTTGADDVRINNGIGDVDDDGDTQVTITRDTTFTLTARNGSDSDTCTVKVTVDEDDRDTNETPRCELRISDTDIRKGEKVTLSWDNTRTDRMILNDNYGKEIADSRDDNKINEDKDSIVVHPTRSTDYTLTVYNGSKSKTCKVGVDVEDGISITSTRIQDGISLTQVPYTGFEAGPVLTFIFYGAIALWGVVIAYALVVRRKTLAVAGMTASTHNTHAVTASVLPEVATTFDEAPLDLLIAEEVEQTLSEDALHALEVHAHSKYALISSDALRFIESQNGTLSEQMATLDKVIALAKAQFPKEDEWAVINKERVMALLG